ncbi:receptor-like protein Cf-9 homolog isoform X1 [Rosa rugosa]|uniref:receptor-like protein Cf-9 homolog isoform X1 n=1 Tax=Rosa rugosa TaxID=74645 RepID=UPI002B40062A|nr:receptor-like protein Cf-9 homolog isoform X1 [Rosa rugosa]
MVWWFSWLCLLFFLFTSQLNCSLSSSNSSSPPSSRHVCNSDESSALLQFKNSFQVNHSIYAYPKTDFFSPKTDSWAKEEDCCKWSGVTCERVTGHVSGLNLSYGGLQGILHPNSSLFSLGHLKMLDLSFNDFMGSSIFKFGGFVSMTHLHLTDSHFTGKIPSEISQLSKLVSLELSSYSSRPYEKTTIDMLTMKGIAQNLTSLRVLSLQFVDMSSVIPDSFLNLSSSLTSLWLSFCNLRGKFPENVFHLPNLEELKLFGNTDLTGYTPKSNWSSPLNYLGLSETKISIDLHFLTSSLKSLRYLYLQKCNFTGSRSHLELSDNLTQLMSLDLSGNSFGGHIPWSLLNLEHLHYLDLSSNIFVGLPEIHGNSTKASSTLHDSSKKQLLGGSIPMGLTFLSLYNNLLSGTIPSLVYSLPSLEYLHLGNNEFTGNIKDFQSLSLSYLYLNNNKLHGMIPNSIYGLVKLSDLYIASNNLSGVVKFEKFQNLQSLIHLDLSYNCLTVSFQNFSNYTLPKLSSLHMSGCKITQFPHFLRTSTQLRSLDLSNNQIQGNVPTWVLDVGRNSLSYFLMSNNQLTGALPSTICNLTSVQVIDLSKNSLSGRIPQCIGNFSQKLSDLDLHLNKFRGKIPSTFPKGNILRDLNLRGNQLEGTLPKSLINCTKMEVLDLGDNKLNDTFPNWLESLPELQVLILRSNRLYGPIGSPETRFPFRKLRIIDLSHNQFGGPLPTKYFQKLVAMKNVQDDELKYMGESYYQDTVTVVMKGLYLELVKIQTMFTTIDFSNNVFTGEIPGVIGKLKSLKGLNFSSNKLNGSIPSAFVNLTSLEWLDISSNVLSGEIPRQLADLTWLAKLNLSGNQLVGPIPRGKQFETFENDSYSGNLGLCGSPLSKTCINDEAPQPPTFDQQDGDMNVFDWKIVWMGYGCGMVIGLSVGYIVLSIAKVDRGVRVMGRKIRSRMAKRAKKTSVGTRKW